MTSWLIFPSPSTGNGCHIELSGIDLWLIISVDYVFVYRSNLDIDRFTEALGRTLSLWPIVAGRLLVLEGTRYVIEMSDNGIPVSFTDNSDLIRWPLDSHVVVDVIHDPLLPFLDKVHTVNILRNSKDEPLFRLKLTRIVQSGEWVMGVSWSHVLGDADAYFHFLNTISRLYQQMEPLPPLPVFERRLWHEDEADRSLLPVVKQFRDARPIDEMMKILLVDQEKSDQLNVCFSGEQLTRLRTRVDDTSVTNQDVLTAYIIHTLNNHCFNNHEQRILRTNTVINFRGVSDSIAQLGLVANCNLFMLSDDFDDPESLSSIAKTIRRSIIQSRNPNFLEHCLASTDKVMREIARDDRLAHLGYHPNEIFVNSHLRYDWAGVVDFGCTDRCRFYMAKASLLFLRVFRLNPVYDGPEWKTRDRDGAEVTFCIEKNMKDKFVNAWQKDILENFANVKN